MRDPFNSSKCLAEGALISASAELNELEALVTGSRRRVSVSQDSHLRAGSHYISFKSHVKSLGIYIDANLSVAKHIDHTSRSA